ncbi:hypothetical protein [Methanoregula sp.]|uniref:hypothetical protein n=1 Tax=Methanoregula sp. TaxID=2052170 RepID=UPI003569E615
MLSDLIPRMYCKNLSSGVENRMGETRKKPEVRTPESKKAEPKKDNPKQTSSSRPAAKPAVKSKK